MTRIENYRDILSAQLISMDFEKKKIGTVSVSSIALYY